MIRAWSKSTWARPMLEITGLDVAYGDFQVLWNVDLVVPSGHIVCLLGPNGAGKSTVMNAVTGLVPRRAGRIMFEGHDLSTVPTHEMAGLGIGHVLERRRLFPTLTVRQNLMLGAWHTRAKQQREQTIAGLEARFPLLAERRDGAAGKLSGGEQQLVAIARGLMSRPTFLMIDEPFLGLSPKAIDDILAVLQVVNRDGVSVLFTEQNVRLALSVSHRGYLLESGRIVLTGTGEEMLDSPKMREVYLGI